MQHVLLEFDLLTWMYFIFQILYCFSRGVRFDGSMVPATPRRIPDAATKVLTSFNVAE